MPQSGAKLTCVYTPKLVQAKGEGARHAPKDAIAVQDCLRKVVSLRALQAGAGVGPLWRATKRTGKLIGPA